MSPMSASRVIPILLLGALAFAALVLRADRKEEPDFRWRDCAGRHDL